MKKRRSFFRRHSIAIGILVIVAIFSVTTTLMKQEKYDELKQSGEEYLAEIEALEIKLKRVQNDLEEIDSLDFVEKYARETLKMVSPDEVYFQIHYTDEE